jgi:hypothetical protein
VDNTRFSTVWGADIWNDELINTIGDSVVFSNVPKETLLFINRSKVDAIWSMKMYEVEDPFQTLETFDFEDKEPASEMFQSSRKRSAWVVGIGEDCVFEWDGNTHDV